MSKDRFETFSDGVIAIAITLLVLEIKIPEPVDGSLARGLIEEWPSFAAFAVSFFTIGIFWINHHVFFRYVEAIDHGIVLINLVLLMWISLWPFTTALLADYLRDGAHQFGAAFVYVGASLGMSVTWETMYAHVRRNDLLDHVPSVEHRRYLTRRNTLGFAGYLTAIGLAFVSATAALAMCGLVAVYYMLPGREDPAVSATPAA